MSPCNTTLEDAFIVEDPLWKGYTFHHFGLFLCAIFGGISVLVSLWLIWMHATHYLRPSEQKQTIRILFMIPVYSVVSFLSYMFYRKAIYFEVLRDCYEAFAISSFFALLCHYIAPNLHEQKDYFRGITPKNWFWGVFGLQKCTGGEHKGPFRKPRSGLTWFNVIWAGIFQYCLIRVLFTIVSVISEVFDQYCEASLSPAYAHIWVLVFESMGVTVAMFMVVQFYIQLKDDLSEHKPFLKVLSIKLVIFFSFWQTIVISLLSSESGPLKPTKTLAYQDIKIGIPSVLLCIEMAGFSVMHIFAYPWKPYSIKHMPSDPLMASGAGYSGGSPHYQGGKFGMKAIMDAFNPWDIIKSIARGFRWIFVGRRKRHDDISYKPTKMGNDSISYTGPTFAGSGEAATELQPDMHRRGEGGQFDDRAGLLSHSQQPAGTHMPYSAQDYSPPRGLSASHLSAPGRVASPAVAGRDVKSSQPYPDDDQESDDWDQTEYHPGIGPSSAAQEQRTKTNVIGPSGSVHVHPVYREDQQQQQQQGGWNMLGGAYASTHQDPEIGEGSSSPPPPSYRS